MPRRFQQSTLVIASHNPGKVREITALLEPFGVTIKSAAGLGLPEPEETGTTFTANAELKTSPRSLSPRKPSSPCRHLWLPLLTSPVREPKMIETIPLPLFSPGAPTARSS